MRRDCRGSLFSSLILSHSTPCVLYFTRNIECLKCKKKLDESGEETKIDVLGLEYVFS